MNIDKYLEDRDFCAVEKILLEQYKEQRDNVPLLFNLAMVRLQFPFEDEEKAIYYLNRIIEIDKYNFNALIIKMYLQNFCCMEPDEDFSNLINHKWDSNYKKSIIYYILSWKAEDEKMEYLKKAVNEYSEFALMFERLGYIYEHKKMYKDAYECFLMALQNVKTTEFPPEAAIDENAFIEEYILGISISDINYNCLKKLVDSSKDNYIESIIYNYYPKHCEFGSKEYIETKEYKSYINAINKDLISKDFKKAFKESLNDYHLKEWSSEDKAGVHFSILLHKYQDILDDDTELIECLGGQRLDLEVFISKLMKVYYICVTETRYKDDTWSFKDLNAFDIVDKDIISKLENVFDKQGYFRLENDLVNKIVPDIETELHYRGEVKVFHCLFSDLEV